MSSVRTITGKSEPCAWWLREHGRDDLQVGATIECVQRRRAHADATDVKLAAGDGDHRLGRVGYGLNGHIETTRGKLPFVGRHQDLCDANVRDQTNPHIKGSAWLPERPAGMPQGPASRQRSLPPPVRLHAALPSS